MSDAARYAMRCYHAPALLLISYARAIYRYADDAGLRYAVAALICRHCHAMFTRFLPLIFLRCCAFAMLRADAAAIFFSLLPILPFSYLLMSYMPLLADAAAAIVFHACFSDALPPDAFVITL